MTAAGPLSGLRVLEACHMLAGPYCGMILADLGAEVIKIESPEGDIARRISPHRIGPHNLYFASLNRNKRSVVLDLATPQGQADLARLAASADALVTNMRPSAIRKLGLTYDSLKQHNRKIACLALTGYGMDGPWSDLPAYDYVIQALVGLMMLTGNPGEPPVKTGYSVVDNSSGLMGAVALLAKIVEGRGGQIDVSLYDTMLSQMNYLAGSYLNAGERPERQSNGAHPYIVPAQIFPTADGHLVLFITHDEFWRRFAAELGQAHWLEDPRFATMAGRSANRDLVLRQIGTVLAAGRSADWVRRLSPLGLVVADLRRLEEAIDCELTEAREMVVSVATADGPLRMIGSPIKIDGYRPGFAPPPLLGQHNGEILAEPVGDPP